MTALSFPRWRKTLRLLIVLLICVFCFFSLAPASPQIMNARNPQVVKVIDEVNPANIEAIIRKLVSFKTRQTMSRSDIWVLLSRSPCRRTPKAARG